VVVARFLALLELYREGAVAFEQVDALGELSIRWAAEDNREFGVGDEFDGTGPTHDGPTYDGPTYDGAPQQEDRQ
jgi:segregation and condensation protein A